MIPGVAAESTILISFERFCSCHNLRRNLRPFQNPVSKSFQKIKIKSSNRISKLYRRLKIHYKSSYKNGKSPLSAI